MDLSFSAFTDSTQKTIAFHGLKGAFADLACCIAFPNCHTLPCSSFEDALKSVSEGVADWAMIPVANSIAGRVADVHALLPSSGLVIVREFFIPIVHCLLGVKGSTLADIRTAFSHEMALSQCRQTLQGLGIASVPSANTSAAAASVAEGGNPAHAAIASELAAEIYGLQILQKNLEDEAGNTTRFLLMAREICLPTMDTDADGLPNTITSLVFQVRNIPAALYKSIGGFATNGLNLLRLESYMLGGEFASTQFYLEVQSHIDSPAMQNALEELSFFAVDVKILGVYPADLYRLERIHLV